MSQDILRILGQITSVNGGDQLLYSVPAQTKASVTTITACNCGIAPASFSVRVVNSAETNQILNKHFIYKDLYLGTNDTFTATFVLSLNTGDRIVVSATGAEVAFNAFGLEIFQ